MSEERTRHRVTAEGWVRDRYRRKGEHVWLTSAEAKYETGVTADPEDVGGAEGTRGEEAAAKAKKEPKSK